MLSDTWIVKQIRQRLGVSRVEILYIYMGYSTVKVKTIHSQEGVVHNMSEKVKDSYPKWYDAKNAYNLYHPLLETGPRTFG